MKTYSFKLKINGEVGTMEIQVAAAEDGKQIHDYRYWAFVEHTHNEKFHKLMSDLFAGKFPNVAAFKYLNEYDAAKSVILEIGDYHTVIDRK